MTRVWLYFAPDLGKNGSKMGGAILSHQVARQNNDAAESSTHLPFAC